jgi:hypothetical protein
MLALGSAEPSGQTQVLIGYAAGLTQSKYVVLCCCARKERLTHKKLISEKTQNGLLVESESYN